MKEADDHSCDIHAPIINDVTSQIECQAKCESNKDCLGIAYSHDPNHNKFCYLCIDDSLIPISNQFAFYRKPGNIGHIQRVFLHIKSSFI